MKQRITGGYLARWGFRGLLLGGLGLIVYAVRTVRVFDRAGILAGRTRAAAARANAGVG